jgi:formylglycine-generating enzyme required for sulfatase activity
MEQLGRMVAQTSLKYNYSIPPDSPHTGIKWDNVAAYCTWLSKEEGIPRDQWCYEIKGNELTLKENSLSLTGYRLPTEAEMEYAIRAEALTSRHFGETDELMPEYAWFRENSQSDRHPVGRLKPNDFGLFDVHGNVYTWCLDCYRAYPKGKADVPVGDNVVETVIPSKGDRVVRGGAYIENAIVCRAASRWRYSPENGPPFIGYRVARTLPLGSTALPRPTDGGSKIKN